MSGPEDAPSGTGPLRRSSAFLDLIGPVWEKTGSDPISLVCRVADKHGNTRGVAHGGFLVTLADVALGYALAFAEDPPAPLATASLTADFVGTVRVGDLIESRVELLRSGRRLAFADVRLVVGDTVVLRASGVFARMG